MRLNGNDYPFAMNTHRPRTVQARNIRRLDPEPTA